jgi:hypothetical protein
MAKFIQLSKGRRQAQNDLKEYFFGLLGTNKLKTLRENFEVENNQDLYEHLELVNNELYLIEQKEKKQTMQRENTGKQKAKSTERKRVLKEQQEFLSNFNIDLPEARGDRTTRRRPLDILMTIKTTVVWHGEEEKSYPDEFVIAHTFTTTAQLLPQEVETFVNTQFPMQDSGKTTYLDSYTFEIRREITRHVDRQDVGMREAFPFKASFLQYMEKVDPISFQMGHGECVIDALSEHLKVKGKPMSKTNLRDLFDEASQHLYQRPYKQNQGITARMILYVCREKNISCIGFDQTNNIFIKHTRDETKAKTYRAIIFYMFCSHFYLVSDEPTVRSISACFRENNTFHTDMKIDEGNKNEDKALEFYANLPVEECLNLPKNSYVIFEKSNLNEEFVEYVRITNDAMPHIKYGNLTGIRSIQIPNNITLATSGCFGEGLKWEDIRSICSKCDIHYRNQSLGNLLIQIKDKFYETTRVQFTKQEREKVKAKSDDQCACCNIKLGDSYHIDHIRSLANGGDNNESNLQALCGTCHRDKSRQENENCEYIKVNEFISSFNIQISELMQTNFFRKVAFTEKVPFDDSLITPDHSLHAIDMIKDRRNLLQHSENSFGVYSVIDNIEPFDGEIQTGMYYVECQDKFPLRGNQFYSNPMIDYTLANGLIDKDNIKYQLLPSYKIEKGYFKKFVDHLLDLFKDSPQLQKLSINSMVGLFGRRKNKFIEHRICNGKDIDDIACAYHDLTKPYINKINPDLVSITGEVSIQKLESYFPIHLQILDCEAIELHKLSKMIESNGGIVTTLKTDCVYYYAKAPIDCENFFWDEKETVRKYRHEEAIRPLENPIIITHTDKLELEFKDYENLDENDADLIETIINSDKGCLILGPAGTGKTYTINKIIEKLNSKDLLRLAPTNKSAILINGTTLDKFTYAYLNGGKKSSKYKFLKYIFVDEVSMVREMFYKVLLSMKFANPKLKFIICGDFYQLEPVMDKCIKSYEMSRALYELVGGRKLNLTVCKRSDDRLFRLCENVKNEVAIDTSVFGKNKSYLNICFTNERRKKVNAECVARYLKENQKRTVQVEKLHYDDNSQSYTLMEGMPVISRLNKKSLDIVNNETFEVLKIGKDSITVKNEMKTVIVPIKDISRTFNIGFCITTHKSQGETFDKPYTIYEWHKMDSRLRYVALSRATDIKNINIM